MRRRSRTSPMSAARGRPGKALVDLAVDAVERVFAVVEQRRAAPAPKAAIWRASSRADRAAGAGDQHAPAGDERAHAGAVEHGLRPAEQILDRDRLDAAAARRSTRLLEIGEARQPRQRDAELVGDVEEPAHRGAVERRRVLMIRRCGRSPRCGRAARRPSRMSSIVPSTGTPPMSRPTRAAAVGDEADDAIEPRRVARRRADEEIGVLARADQQHRDRGVARRARADGRGRGPCRRDRQSAGRPAAPSAAAS